MQYKLTVEELCVKLKPVFGKKMDELYLKYAMAGTREERDEIEHILNALYHKHLSELLGKKVLLEPPSQQVIDGEYPLATISYADKKLYPLILREQDWIRHVCISGMSGSGKTTLAFHIISNFIEKQKPFLVFDWKKSFRPLMLVDSEIMCFTVGDEKVSNLFKMNVNKPPEGIPPKEWINVLCDLITESFFASYGVHKIILETLDEAFRDFGVYSGSGNYPTWNEIKWRLETKLEKKKGREASWLMSALRIAHVLTFGNFGKVLNYKGRDSLSVGDLLNKKVIFELNALGAVEKKFFCEFILTYIYKLKKAKQVGLNENFDHAILVDEAHNIFLKEKTHFVNESVTDVIYREMREYGTALICLDQHISKISDTVAGNSACHVAFQQQLPQDIECISGLMQLRDRRQFFSMLPVGSAIVKLAERYTRPFLVEVPRVELRSREISDRDIAERMKCIFQGKAIEQGEDPEFREALIHPQLQEISGGKGDERLEEVQLEEEQEEKEGQIEEPEAKVDYGKLEPVEIKTASLTEVQKILYDFVQKKLELGAGIKEIERVMEEFAVEGNYSLLDVAKVVSYAQANSGAGEEEKEEKVENTDDKLGDNKVYKPELLSKNELNEGQEKFLSFLQNNPDSEYGTVGIYKALGLSARKGNKIKNELLSKGLIKIEEQKNEKGWKKIIKPAFKDHI